MIPIPSQHDDEDTEGAASVWGFLLSLFIFKLVTVIVIFWHMRTWESGLILGVTSWYFLTPLLILGAVACIFSLRWRTVRAGREALRRAEWMLDEHEVPASAARRR